jgi:hypothetical protein
MSRPSPLSLLSGPGGPRFQTGTKRSAHGTALRSKAHDSTARPATVNVLAVANVLCRRACAAPNAAACVWAAALAATQKTPDPHGGDFRQPARAPLAELALAPLENGLARVTRVQAEPAATAKQVPLTQNDSVLHLGGWEESDGGSVVRADGEVRYIAPRPVRRANSASGSGARHHRDDQNQDSSRNRAHTTPRATCRHTTNGDSRQLSSPPQPTKAERSGMGYPPAP